MTRWHWIVTLSCALSGCALHPTRVSAIDPGGCPPALREAVSLSASVAQVSVPAGLRIPSGSVRLYAGTGRRVLLATQITAPLPSVRLLGNSLSIITYGGVLADWARVVDPPAAGDSESIAVQGGWLQIAPFISSSRLHPDTQAIDLLVIPGGRPIAGLALQPGPMWRRDGSPVPPDRLHFRLTPEINMTKLHTVGATATLRLAMRHLTGAHEHWQCSVTTNFTLVNRGSGLPNLWILRDKGQHAPRSRVLLFYDRRIGAFKAVFLDPDTAHGFALWESETHAARAGPFALGFIDRSVPAAFTPISRAATEDLAVAQWGTK